MQKIISEISKSKCQLRYHENNFSIAIFESLLIFISPTHDEGISVKLDYLKK